MEKVLQLNIGKVVFLTFSKDFTIDGKLTSVENGVATISRHEHHYSFVDIAKVIEFHVKTESAL